MKVKGRRYSYRSVIPTALVAALLLPFLFIRTAFLALDAGASICPSISCLKVRIGPLLFAGSDTSLEFVKELRRAYVDMEERGEPMDPKVVEAAPESMDNLLADMTAAASSYKHVNIKTFVLETKAMLMKMDQKVQMARLQASIYRHLASIGIPKNLHCLTLRLAEEYLVNAHARSSLPPPEFASRLTNASFLHIALLTDNILAAAVAVSSTVRSSANPEKLVFHIVTDKKTYTAMHAWFALNPMFPAILEVKGLHQFEWPSHINATIMATVEELHQGLRAHRYYTSTDQEYRRYEASTPSSFSLLNYLKIHLPELFPNLERVIFLDDDVVVRRDLTPLWDMDLNGNAIASVGLGDGRGGRCVGKTLGGYLNFSNPLLPLISFGLKSNQCSWLGGMHVFDLGAWRETNITEFYQHLLKQNRKSGFALWRLGWLPPALIAFEGRVQPIDPSWHLSGLGQRMPKPEALESAAVLHFSGPRKPWLDIGFPLLRELWRTHLNHTNQFLRSCRVVE